MDMDLFYRSVRQATFDCEELKKQRLSEALKKVFSAHQGRIMEAANKVITSIKQVLQMRRSSEADS